MPAMTAVPPMRARASPRRCTGTRETSSTVSSRARGGHAAIVCEIGLSRACKTFAHTEAATPTARVARTAHWKRRSWATPGGAMWSMLSPPSVCRGVSSVGCMSASTGQGGFQLAGGDPTGGLGRFGFAEVGEAVFQQPHSAPDRVGAPEAAVDTHHPLVQLLVDRILVDGGFEDGDGLLGLVGLQDLGDAGVHAEDLVAVGGGVVQRPGAVLAVGEVAVVFLGRLAQRGQGCLVVGGGVGG